MIAAHFRAYRSEPPPTAVLMTNSTGLVGCTIVATDAAEPLGVGAVPVLLAQAVRVMSAAARIAVIRIADLDMTRTSMLQVRTAVSKGSHRRSDRDLSCHNGGSGSARGVRSAGPELVRSRGRARSVGMVQELTRPTSLRRGAAPDTAFAFLDGEFIPVRDAKVSVLTHAFNYGTGVFEGIRAYWNAQDEQLYSLHLKEHFLRLHRSCRIMRIGLPYTADDLVGITLELLRKCNYRDDAYIRPIAYKSSPDNGIPTAIRQVDRTELYVADEVSLCGTGAQISPVTSIDHRAIGKGERGPLTAKVSEIYFDAVHGKAAKYRSWVTPVYKR